MFLPRQGGAILRPQKQIDLGTLGKGLTVDHVDGLQRRIAHAHEIAHRLPLVIHRFHMAGTLTTPSGAGDCDRCSFSARTTSLAGPGPLMSGAFSAGIASLPKIGASTVTVLAPISVHLPSRMLEAPRKLATNSLAGVL